MAQTSGLAVPALYDVIICRVCLASTGKLFLLETSNLKEAFFDITGIQVMPGDGLPQYICYICCGILRKAVQFRKKCHNMQSLISRLTLLDLKKQTSILHDATLKITNIMQINIGGESKKKLISMYKEFEIDQNGKELQQQAVEELENDSNDKQFENFVKAEVFQNDLKGEESDNDLNNEELQNNLNAEEFQNDFKAEEFQNNLKSEQSENVIYYKENSLRSKALENDLNSFNCLSSDYDEWTRENYCENNGDDLEQNIDEQADFKNGKANNRVNTKIFKQKIENDTDVVDKKVTQYNLNDSFVDPYRNDVVKQKVKKTTKLQKVKTTKLQTNRNKDQHKQLMERASKYEFDVKIFSKEEQVKNMLERKESERYQSSTYKCEDCYIGFNYKEKYNKHRAHHDAALSGNYECGLCKMKFRTRACLNRHLRRHEHSYVCRTCGKSFVSEVYCKDHYLEHNGGITYQCPFCPAVFKKIGRHADHVRTNHGSERCHVCYAMLTPRGVMLHMKLQHKKIYECDKCAKVFNSADALEKHLKMSPNAVCNPNDWPCRLCGENYSAESLLSDHIKSYHTTTGGRVKGKRIKRSEQSVRSGSLMCEVCARILPSKAHLIMHMRVHTGEKPFQCNLCDKKFRVQCGLRNHIRTHTGERPFKCSECPKAFGHMSNLLTHGLVHSKVRPHKCEICDKSFQQLTSVKLHVRTVHMNMPMPSRVRKKE